MSDEDRDEPEDTGPREGESEHDWMQRQMSPELRWLDLFRRLTTRVETNDSRLGTHEEESRRRAEETQRKMDFIVSQQAQFSADLQRSKEEQEERWRQQEERWKKADARWAETERGIRGLLAIAEIHEREIEALKESQERTGQRLAETGERVDALVNTVERLISERRNGGKGRVDRDG